MPAIPHDEEEYVDDEEHKEEEEEDGKEDEEGGDWYLHCQDPALIRRFEPEDECDETNYADGGNNLLIHP